LLDGHQQNIRRAKDFLEQPCYSHKLLQMCGV